jgi:ribonuclease P protein component
MERIRKSSEYRILSNCGARHYSNYFIIVSRENQNLRSRLGITVSKKVGKAVTRNRIKRIIREYFRVNRSILPVQLDINVIARKASATIGNDSLREKLGCLLNTMAKKSHPTAWWPNWHYYQFIFIKYSYRLFLDLHADLYRPVQNTLTRLSQPMDLQREVCLR